MNKKHQKKKKKRFTAWTLTQKKTAQADLLEDFSGYVNCVAGIAQIDKEKLKSSLDMVGSLILTYRPT